MKNWKRAALVMMIVLCASGTAHAEEAAAEADRVIEIGQAVSDNDFKVLLKNRSGYDIVSVSVQVNDQETGEDLMADGDVLADEKDGYLVFPPAAAGEGNDVIPVYNIELVFEDDMTGILHTFPFGDTDTVTIRRGLISKDQLDDEDAGEDAEVAYITFTSRFLGTEQDTRWHEWNLIAPEKAGEAAAKYAEKIAAQRSQGGGYSGGSGYSSGGSGNSGSSGSSSGGADDWCLDAGLIF